MTEILRQQLTLNGLDEKIIDEIIECGRMRKLETGEVLVSPDITGNEMPVVINGLLKVSRRESTESEIFLYFLEAGETCAMSLSCCLEGKKMAMRVTAEEDSEVWMVPIANLDTWVVKYPSFRRFVFRSYQERFNELIGTLDTVVFAKMDERIYRYLLDKKQASGTYVIEKTHEQIAKDLNTSRVVVSRILKQMEKEEKIEQYRNRIEVL